MLTLIIVAALPLTAADQAPAADQAITATEQPGAALERDVTEDTFCSARAYCEESGTWLYCSGYHICVGHDQDCAAGEQGSVFCKGGLIQQCPPCPTESVE
jgi:hypothetical protein